jgi:hypothetical protein
MKKIIYTAAIALLGTYAVSAQQFDVNADMRARFENRNGYSTLKGGADEAASFISQRARIIFDYSFKNVKLRFSPQNVRTWGDVSTTSKGDLYNAFHEAYGEVKMDDQWAFKVGRQELNYDDARILGNVDWNMQGRSHDAFVFKFSPNAKNQFHLGLALNANKDSNFKEAYAVTALTTSPALQYKAMQYLWYHTDFKQVGLSLLALNNGMEFSNAGKLDVAYSQTLGGRVTYKNGGLSLDGASYLQTGKIGLNNVSAHYLSANLNYKVNPNFNAGLGFEILSGKDKKDGSTDIKSFSPLYGTNHKFNGYMDYFYVGNHANSVGLNDIYVNLGYERNKFTAKLTPHYFTSNAPLYNLSNVKQDSYLGTEIDFTLGYKMYDNVTVEGGFSQMFATTSMEVLKGGSKDAGNNWAFISVKINPNLFSHKQ